MTSDEKRCETCEHYLRESKLNGLCKLHVKVFGPNDEYVEVPSMEWNDTCPQHTPRRETKDDK